MPYARSRARAECETALKGLLSVARMVAGLRVPGSVRQATFQGVVVQIHSCLEEYFGSVVADWLKKVRDASHRIESVPPNARTWIVHSQHLDGYRYFSYQADERRFLADADVRTYEQAYFCEGADIPESLSAKTVIGTHSYPSFANIKTVLFRLGIGDTRRYLSKKLEFDAELYMKSISDIRASVAHRYALPMAHGDVKAYCRKISTLVKWLDHRLYQAVISGSGSDIWSRMR